MNKYRIVQYDYANGITKYAVEMQVNEAFDAWDSIFRHVDLEEARRVKKEREDREIVSHKVIE